MEICEACVLWELEQARDHFGELAEKILQARKTMCESVCIILQRLINQYYMPSLAKPLRVVESGESFPKMAFIFLERCETVE